MTNSPFLTRVVLKNYKSIEACDVDLHSLTFLVGANGAGKSNFLDAAKFVWGEEGAPRTGAWIETAQFLTFKKVVGCRSPHGSVD